MIKTMPRWSRMGAFLIDITTINALTRLILSIIPTDFFILTYENFSHDIMVYFLLLLFQVAVATLYTTLFYKVAGATFGKFFLKVDIVSSETGKEISTIEMAKREQLKWILVYSTLFIYVMYGAYCVFTKKEMLHEKISKTKIM